MRLEAFQKIMKELALDRNSTALVIIDLQKGITSMPTEPNPASTVISNAAKLKEAFRKNGMPVFPVHVTPSGDGKDRLNPITDQEPYSGHHAMQADWADFVPELGVTDEDFAITKRQWGAFTGTELDLQLRRRGIQTIVLCGISTNFGVESTARFAFEYGYQQIFVEDATAARSREEHENTFRYTFSRIGRVRTTEEVLKGLE